MARKEKEYRKLPGRGFRKRSLLEVSRTLCTLWTGKDHLLLVDSQGGYSEDYKRFYYRDIQALIIRKTTVGRTANLVLASFAALFILAGLPDMDIAWRVFWFIMSATMLTFLLINWVRGPTCVCHLRTAVQTEVLPSLNRLRTARKALRLLKPRIEEAQGQLAPEEIPGQVEQLVRRAVEEREARAAAAALTTPFSPPPLVTRYQSRAHAVLFSLLLVEAARQGGHIFASHIVLVVIEMLLVAAISITVVVALIQQQQTDLSVSVRRLTWGAAGLIGFGLLAGYVNWMILAMRRPGVVQNNWELLQAYADMAALDLPWLLGVFLINFVGCLLLGAAGLYYLQQYRQTRPQPPLLAPVQPPASSNHA